MLFYNSLKQLQTSHLKKTRNLNYLGLIILLIIMDLFNVYKKCINILSLVSKHRMVAHCLKSTEYQLHVNSKQQYSVQT